MVTVAEGNHAASCSYHTVQRKQADISPDAANIFSVTILTMSGNTVIDIGQVFFSKHLYVVWALDIAQRR
jgi:hypothetical protein